MSEWQAISSSPKDGSWFLAFDKYHGRTEAELPVVIVSYRPKHDPKFPWLENSGMQSFGVGTLTHWMPLPAPPED